MRPDGVLGNHGVVDAHQSALGRILGGNRVGQAAYGAVAHTQSRGRACADLDVVVVLVRVVHGAEVDLQLSRGFQAAAVVRAAGQAAVQQLDAVEVRGVGDSGNFRSHGLVLRVDHEPLGGVVGAGGRLFRQFLHAGQLFVDDAQGAVSGLDKGNGVIGVAHALLQGGDVCAHELADGKAGGVVRRGVDAQARGQALG